MNAFKRLKLGVLASGSGSNLQSIIDRIEAGALNAEISVTISNKPDAYALVRCEKHGIPAVVIRHQDFRTREDFDRRMIGVLQAHAVELVVMAGFMRVLTPVFLKAFPMRIMNIHPALLPAFPGTHVQQQAIDYGVKFSGCTVHFADEGVDTGPVIIQAVVPVLPQDTADTLAARILREEHRIYPQAIQFYAEGRLLFSGRRVIVQDCPAMPEQAVHNPPLSGF
ncbi:MAG: phosphoribosylglycinamide formyltransferase [Syntrophales bacterium]|nr:phosphoribosylglycinamide formyltransferase [Syntrophales bacterium]PKN60263.1 MAG: phosphoribosylglycinamide formyltransferase [Deltaproteobacteria bacterium HGW-Deltaproteobacteria-11]